MGTVGARGPRIGLKHLFRSPDLPKPPPGKFKSTRVANSGNPVSAPRRRASSPPECRARSRDQPMDPSTAATSAPRPGALVLSVAPGLLLAAAVAFSADRVGGWEASLSQSWLGRPVAIAPPVIALLIGIALHGVAARPQFTSGSSFAIKKVLRWAIALFGLNIAFADIRGLGLSSAAMVILTMIATLAAGLLFARLFRLGDTFGALAGAACAVCGASAALATSSVLPDSRDRETNTAFVVITTNLIATFAVVAYPPFCTFF